MSLPQYGPWLGGRPGGTVYHDITHDAIVVRFGTNWLDHRRLSFPVKSYPSHKAADEAARMMQAFISDDLGLTENKYREVTYDDDRGLRYVSLQLPSHCTRYQMTLTHGKIMEFHPDDLRKIMEKRWAALHSRRTWYAVSFEDDTTTPCHKYLTGYAMTDHWDGDGLNNHRDNLSETTVPDNNKHRRKYSSNTSGFPGLSEQGNGILAFARAGGVRRKKWFGFAACGGKEAAEADALAFRLMLEEEMGLEPVDDEYIRIRGGNEDDIDIPLDRVMTQPRNPWDWQDDLWEIDSSARPQYTTAVWIFWPVLSSKPRSYHHRLVPIPIGIPPDSYWQSGPLLIPGPSHQIALGSGDDDADKSKRPRPEDSDGDLPSRKRPRPESSMDPPRPSVQSSITAFFRPLPHKD